MKDGVHILFHFNIVIFVPHISVHIFYMITYIIVTLQASLFRNSNFDFFFTPLANLNEYLQEGACYLFRALVHPSACNKWRTAERILFEFDFKEFYRNIFIHSKFDSSEIIPTRCNNCVYSSQWLYSTCFG